MPANRTDFVTIEETEYELVYHHDGESLILNATDDLSLEEVPGQYVKNVQRRDIVANDLIHANEVGSIVTHQDLIKYGFRPYESE